MSPLLSPLLSDWMVGANIKPMKAHPIQSLLCLYVTSRQGTIGITAQLAIVHMGIFTYGDQRDPAWAEIPIIFNFEWS